MAIDYYVEFITVPTAAVVLLILDPPFSNATVSSWIAGYLLWVLTEYWMHRWVFHVKFRKQHWVHHLHPLDPGGRPGTSLTHAALALTCAALWAVCGLTIGLAASGGFLVGYISYIYTHDGVHRAWIDPENTIARRHALHHKGYEKNFNLLCPLGDLVFGTYLEPK